MYLGNIPIVTVNDLPYMHTEIVEAFTSRQTANGLTVVNPSPAVVQMIKGKTVKTTNLIPFPYQNGSTTINGVTFTQNSDGSVAVKGTATSYVQYYLNGTRFNPIVFTVGKTYTVSGGKDGVVVNTRKNGVSWGDSINGSAKTITFNDGDTYNFIGLYIASGTTVDTVIYPMLNDGPTAKPFVPYFSGLKHANFKAIKSTGKNVLKVKDYTNTYGGVTVTVKDNKFTATGTATAHIELWLPLEAPLQAGTYSSILSVEKALEGTGVTRLFLCPKYRDFDNRKAFAKHDSVVNNITTNFVSNYMALYIPIGNEVNCSIDLMLNIGSTAQPYEPYKVEEYTDGNTYELAEYDYINPQKGEYTKGTETITITGSSFSSGVVIGTASITKTVSLSKYSKMYPFNQKQPCVISDGFTAQANYFSYKPDEGVQSIKTPQIAFYTLGGYVRVYLPLEIASTEEKFIAYFNNNPLTISYELATPTVETLTDYPKEYTAYNGGSETVEQGDTDNSQWGALPITTINYREKLTGNTFFTVPIIKRYGKQLIPFPYDFTDYSENGANITTNNDGSLTIDGTPTGRVYQCITTIVLEKGTYTLSSNYNDAAKAGLLLYLADAKHTNDESKAIYLYYGKATFTVTTTTSYLVTIRLDNGATFNKYRFEPMLSMGSVEQPFEPYKEPWYEY